jgi:hypothetical protein
MAWASTRLTNPGSKKMALSAAQKRAIKKMQAGAKRARAARKKNPGRKANPRRTNRRRTNSAATKAKNYKLAGVPVIPAVIDFAALAGGAVVSSMIKPTVDMQVLARIPGGIKVRGIANLLFGVIAIAVGNRVKKAVKQIPNTLPLGMSVPFMRDGLVDLGIGRLTSGLGASLPAAPMDVILDDETAAGTFGPALPMGALYDPNMSGTLAVGGYEPMGRPISRRIL